MCNGYCSTFPIYDERGVVKRHSLTHIYDIINCVRGNVPSYISSFGLGVSSKLDWIKCWLEKRKRVVLSSLSSPMYVIYVQSASWVWLGRVIEIILVSRVELEGKEGRVHCIVHR